VDGVGAGGHAAEVPVGAPVGEAQDGDARIRADDASSMATWTAAWSVTPDALPRMVASPGPTRAPSSGAFDADAKPWGRWLAP